MIGKRDRHGCHSRRKHRLGVNPLGGAGVRLLEADRQRWTEFAVVNEAIDPTFRFMTVDWDGQIRIVIVDLRDED